MHVNVTMKPFVQLIYVNIKLKFFKKQNMNEIYHTYIIYISIWYRYIYGIYGYRYIYMEYIRGHNGNISLKYVSYKNTSVS
jgi:hypothetical protein